MPPAEMQADPRGRDRACVELALGTDVERIGPERDGDSQADHDERNRPDQRRGRDGVPRAYGTPNQSGQCEPGVVTGKLEAERQSPDAHEQGGCPYDHSGAHHGASAGISPSIIAPIWPRELSPRT
jgi:hypothetical protein